MLFMIPKITRTASVVVLVQLSKDMYVRCMAATTEAARRNTDATAVRLDFDAIYARVADILEIDVEQVTDAAVAGLLGHDRSTIWRWHRGGGRPTFAHAIAAAQKLGLPFEKITGAGGAA